MLVFTNAATEVHKLHISRNCNLYFQKFSRTICRSIREPLSAEPSRDSHTRRRYLRWESSVGSNEFRGVFIGKVGFFPFCLCGHSAREKSLFPIGARILFLMIGRWEKRK